MDQAPIIAIATANGRGGIGVIRVSGKQLTPVIEGICGRSLAPRHATYLPFQDAHGQPIDHGLALHFPAPHSYTGEDVFELQGHGGPVVLQLLLARCLELGKGIGLRLAEPGEFTRRAFLNDKLDLVQAEAVADLIEASTEAAVRSATRSLSGQFSHAIQSLVDALIHLRMLVEATLDFPEEEIDFLQAADAHGQLANIQQQLQQLLANAQQGALLREGLQVVLVGQPNVGKSSLLNALAGAELAIVTPIPGTTRDKVTQTIQIEGIPLHIIDTAGLRDTTDQVEQIGIAHTWAAVEKADVILHLQDATQPAQAPDLAIEERLPPATPRLTVFNKKDLLPDAASFVVTENQLLLSAKQHEGIQTLRSALLKLAGWQNSGEGVFLARARHLHALVASQAHLENAAAHALFGNQHLDLFAEELRLAQTQLNLITGEFSADDLLGEIFTRFCIGK
ncbi:tRNA uridine-5-carboxymethylaminomethyl(34) synthesis GTPase MnmE [Parvibium lacunae]|uniref:tRNA modification GTPase MnmE n=2 Tax=Parvibium lacunae TaxID=1888893 RepID=A0A368L0D4_9BURK|nr:tRNA uridine-5-carboxymethylaminomethyl(34) synthesis GTPase MnmE [Parvibium lacunae]RCS57021.1 tRNA uridine-5-carboxymethylaminomethyl(34) synthesis GTPase MnmE [Parvibium lacunae]